MIRGDFMSRSLMLAGASLLSRLKAIQYPSGKSRDCWWCRSNLPKKPPKKFLALMLFSGAEKEWGRMATLLQSLAHATPNLQFAEAMQVVGLMRPWLNVNLSAFQFSSDQRVWDGIYDVLGECVVRSLLPTRGWGNSDATTLLIRGAIAVELYFVGYKKYTISCWKWVLTATRRFLVLDISVQGRSAEGLISIRQFNLT